MLHHLLRLRIETATRLRPSGAEAGAMAGAVVPAPVAADHDALPEVVGGPWKVCRAGLVDINPIARMLQAHRPFIDLDGDGLPDEVPDEEHAGSATRLVLSHGAFEHGEVWFAQDADGVAAAAVWLPPEAEHLATELRRAVARELGGSPAPDPEPAHAPLESLVDGATHLLALVRGSDARRVLVMLSDAGRAAPADRRPLLADLLAPVVTAELLDGRSVLAVTVDPGQVADLEALGFCAVGQQPLGAAMLWLGAIRPAPAPSDGDVQAATASV
ncbi:MAG TPA: hypothetical protein VGC67_12260 [Cellulomonas sp.]